MRQDALTGRAEGGAARARKLSPKERSDIAKRAAAQRWDTDGLPNAICSADDTPLIIADTRLDAYVLEDGTRVLSEAGLLTALGRKRRAASRHPDIPIMLQGAGLEPFLTPEIIEKGRPISFSTPHGLRANGYRAELLPDVCEIYLKARDANTLAPNQYRVAHQAEILMRSFAKVGIIALVDEATGYQELRAKNALAEILERFIAKELQPYVRTFPEDYYREMFRLRSLQYPEDTVKRPKYFGKLTNDIVYRRLAPGVLNELKKVTPRNNSGNLKHKLFQRLTSNEGYPKLREHLGSVVTIMKLSDSWEEFMSRLNRLHRRYGATIPMDLDDDGKGL